MSRKMLILSFAGSWSVWFCLNRWTFLLTCVSRGAIALHCIAPRHGNICNAQASPDYTSPKVSGEHAVLLGHLSLLFASSVSEMILYEGGSLVSLVINR